MSQDSEKVCLRLKRNPKLYYNAEVNEPSIYPTVFEYGEVSELQTQRLTGLYEEITKIPKITVSDIYKYKTIRASSLVHYGNKFEQQLAMWDMHPLSPNYKELDSDAVNIGSFIHLLFEHDGEPPIDSFILVDWDTGNRSSKKYKDEREKYGFGKPIISADDLKKYKALYPRAIKELQRVGVTIGVSSEHTRYTIPNYLGTGWAFSGTLDRVDVTEDGFHDLVDIKSVDPKKLHEWESGSYTLAKKFNQLEGYRNLYSIIHKIPMEKVRVKFVLIIRQLSDVYLGSCVKVLEPIVQHTQSKQDAFESMFKSLVSFFNDRMNNKALGVEQVKYTPAAVKLKFDAKQYTLVFETLELLCRQNNISFVESQDYFDAGEFKIVTYRLLVKILNTMGYDVNVLTIRKGDSVRYLPAPDGTYIRQHEIGSSPEDKILYYGCEILDKGNYKVIKTDAYTDAEVQETSKRFSSLQGRKFWKNFYEQMANVTVIKHAIRGFMADSQLLETFYKLEQLTYEGLED